MGEKIFVEISMKNQLSEPSIEGIVVNWRDVTERVASERKIAYMANYDELTKLPNRFYFNNRITRLCQKNNKRNSNFALLMLNIDGFKYINHSLGMKSGDTMITEVVKRLQSYLGDDRFICRYSVDQFGVLITDIGQMDKFQKVAQELVDLFNGSFKVEMYELFISVSVGVASIP
ncbi:MAG: GGDEF domain-containing protein [Alkalibacterium sp.]|nr:GGDEF domain-containing protein [Alkalibacterium sp.]